MHAGFHACLGITFDHTVHFSMLCKPSRKLHDSRSLEVARLHYGMPQGSDSLEFYKEWSLKSHLLLEACASIHDEAPQLVAAGHRRDVQAVHVALFHVLLHPGVGHIVVIPLLHWPVSIVDSDPLRCRQTQANLFLRHLQLNQRLSVGLREATFACENALEPPSQPCPIPLGYEVLTLHTRMNQRSEIGAVEELHPMLLHRA